MDDRQLSERFMYLVEEYRLTGWIALGKLKPPQADEVHTDLFLARHAIDTLGMLETKTRGNLNADEERLLRQVLADLRINFADEVKRAEELKKAEAAGTKAGVETKVAEGTEAGEGREPGRPPQPGEGSSQEREPAEGAPRKEKPAEGQVATETPAEES